MNKIVFTNGCFDIIHTGHAALLDFCASIGDRIVVGIDSDQRVKAMKGKNRPINTQDDRSKVLMSIKKVFDVHIFDSDIELKNLVKNISPDIMVVGSDWKNKTVIGSEFSKKILFFERINEYSTTKIIQNITYR
jgi:D-beta-D-heptose 7-phosphate kinase/D-beta-D-heptose 1-phosphate adenosyltransferase